MVNTTFVTVLMSVYNSDQYLVEAIESILNQTYTHFEFLIVNDGSSDMSSSILKSYSAIDSRIVLINNSVNIGLTKSLNVGLKAAKGKLIARMDADDISLPQRLQRQVEFMEAHPKVSLCGTWIKYLGQSKKTVKYNTDNESIRLWLFIDSHFAHPSVIIRKGTLDTYGITYDESLETSQDYKLWVELASVSELANLPEVLLEYREHEGQVSQRHADKQRVNRSKIIDYQYINLGVNTSLAERATFHQLLANDYTLDLDFVKRSERLMNRLLIANSTSGYLEKSMFSSFIKQKWKGLTWGSTRLGMEFYQMFSNSELSGFRELSLIFRVKFIIKCLLKV